MNNKISVVDALQDFFTAIFIGFEFLLSTNVIDDENNGKFVSTLYLLCNYNALWLLKKSACKYTLHFDQLENYLKKVCSRITTKLLALYMPVIFH